MRTPRSPRNTCTVDAERRLGTFALSLGEGVVLEAETHDGDLTTLTLRRYPQAK